MTMAGRFAVPAAGSRIEASEGPLAGDCRIFRRTVTATAGELPTFAAGWRRGAASV